MKNFLIIWRYPFNLAAGIVMIMLFFLAIFFGAKFIGAGNPSFGKTLEDMVMVF